MDNTLETLQKELIELRKLYREAKQSELMLSNMLHFILNNDVPENKLEEFRKIVN